MGSVLRRFAIFFVLFLSVLGVVATARYPVLPESLAAVYRVDKEEAINLSGALTLAGLAACLFLIAAQFTGTGVRRHKRGSGRTLKGVAAVLLLGCVVALAANTLCVRASTRMANAIETAKVRDTSDLLARDLLAIMDDDSVGFWQRYRASIEFLDTVRADELESTDILNMVERAPLQDMIFLTYVLAIFCLKTGFFATSSAICAMGNYAEWHSRL